MGRDRLVELQKLSASGRKEIERTTSESSANTSDSTRRQELQRSRKGNTRGKGNGRNAPVTTLEELQARVSSAQDLLTSIRQNTRQLSTLHSKVLKSAHPEPETAQDIEACVADTQKACTRVCSAIQELERLELHGGGAALERMRANHVSGLRLALAGAMERHEAELQRYAKGLRTLVAKAVSIAKNETYSSAEIDHLLEEGKLQTFIDNYYESEREEKQSILKDVTDRHSELLSVEKSITEIRDLFVQMGALITLQGVTIDKIDAHVTSAVDNTTSGAEQLKKAKEHKSALKKKKVWLTAICGVIVIIVVLAITLPLVLH